MITSATSTGSTVQCVATQSHDKGMANFKRLILTSQC